MIVFRKALDWLERVDFRPNEDGLPGFTPRDRAKMSFFGRCRRDKAAEWHLPFR